MRGNQNGLRRRRKGGVGLKKKGSNQLREDKGVFGDV